MSHTTIGLPVIQSRRLGSSRNTPEPKRRLRRKLVLTVISSFQSGFSDHFVVLLVWNYWNRVLLWAQAQRLLQVSKNKTEILTKLSWSLVKL